MFVTLFHELKFRWRAGDGARISHDDGGDGQQPRRAAGGGLLLSLSRRAGEGRAQSRLTDGERAAVRKGMDAARRGEFVSDEELTRFTAAIADESPFHVASVGRSSAHLRLHEQGQSSSRFARCYNTRRSLHGFVRRSVSGQGNRRAERARLSRSALPILHLYVIEADQVQITHMRHTLRRRP